MNQVPFFLARWSGVILDDHNIRSNLNEDLSSVQHISCDCVVDHLGTTVHLIGIKNLSSSKHPILLIHDLGENIGMYGRVAEALCSKGKSVYGVDLRGHGDSGGQLGHIVNFKQLIKDLLQVVAWIRHEEGKAPVLVAQGIGALIAVFFLKRHSHLCRAAVFCSPCFELVHRVSPIKKFLVKTIAGLSPTVKLPNILAPRLSIPVRSDDTQKHEFRSTIIERLGAPIIPRITANFVNELLQAIEKAPDTFSALKIPCFVAFSSQDSVCSYGAIKALIEDQTDKGLFKLSPVKVSGHNFLLECPPGTLAEMSSGIVSWIDEISGLQTKQGTQDRKTEVKATIPPPPVSFVPPPPTIPSG